MHPKKIEKAECTLFSSAHGTYSRIDLNSGEKKKKIISANLSVQKLFQASSLTTKA